MAGRYRILFISVFVCIFYAANSQQSCYLSNIREQRDFDESRLCGLWYAIRWYPEPEQGPEVELWDVSAVINRQHDGMVWTLNAREKGELDNKCRDTWYAESERVRPGYYNFTSFLSQHWIVYTDYDNFMVNFVCYERQGDNCTRPEVTFWSRDKKARKEDLRKGQELIKDLCMNPKRFLDKLHGVDCVKPPKGYAKIDPYCHSSRQSLYCDRVWGERCSRWRHYLYHCRSSYSCKDYRSKLDHCHDHWDHCYHQ